MHFLARGKLIDITRFVIGVSYVLLGKPLLSRDLTTFVFHEISDVPNRHARETHTFSNVALFRKQITWIKAAFPIVDLRRNGSNELTSGCVLSFDDGYAGVLKNALPILEEYQVPAICFINMATILGEINSSALAMFIADRNGVGVKWHDSNPRFFDETLGVLEENELQEVREYQGPYLTAEELELLSKSALISLGDHSYNHWLLDALDHDGLSYEVRRSRTKLKEYSEIADIIAAPHAVASDSTIYGLAENGYRVLFSGKTFSRRGSIVVHPRIDMSNRIGNKYQFFGVVAIAKCRSKFSLKWPVKIDPHKAS